MIKLIKFVSIVVIGFCIGKLALDCRASSYDNKYCFDHDVQVDCDLE